MPVPIRGPEDLKPGDFYEDCLFHPCLCTEVDTSGGDMVISGISLVDGTNPRGCSVPGCGVRRLTLEEALIWKFFGPQDEDIPEERLWHWDAAPAWVDDARRKMGGK